MNQSGLWRSIWLIYAVLVGNLSTGLELFACALQICLLSDFIDNLLDYESNLKMQFYEFLCC